jgi:glutamate/tyrosine decarboxylase-like PLP-dependent enzyme
MPLRPEAVPDLDWPADRARALADGAVELWQELLERLPSLPVGRPLQEADVRAAVAIDVPEEPLGDEELLGYLRAIVFDHATYAGHPGFMAYVTGPGTPPGAVADLVASGLNENVGAWRLAPAATEIELALTRWLAARFGLPAGSGGLIVSGGAMATMIGLKLARDAALSDVRDAGLDGRRLAVYASEEVHVVTDRACDLLGLGRAAVRRLPTDDLYRIRVDALEQALVEGAAEGVTPMAVVANAGTVATGAVDPLPEIAEVCARAGIWLHVDAAYGGPAVLADDLRPVLAGIERADTIAFDPHKWLYTPHSGGCVLTRDLAALERSFSASASYLYQDVEATGRGIDLGALGPQFSRGFHALKVWVSLLAYGRAAYARRISHDAALARYLGELVEEHPEFELAVPVGLSICCFRYVPSGLPAGPDREEILDRLNEQLLTAIQLDGRSYCSNAVLGERFWLRACIVNFRTEAADVERLLAVAAELGAEIAAELFDRKS